MKTDPYWWDDAGPPLAPKEIPLPTAVDVLVVGAGLTGLTAAWTLAKRHKSVLVLDAGAPGIGASSRNGGLIGGGHRLSINQMESRFGKSTAHVLLHEAHLSAPEFAKRLMSQEKIDCDYVECGRFLGLWRSDQYDQYARELERLQALIPLEAEMVPRDQQKREIATELYAGGAIFPRHGRLNPAKWVAGVQSAARNAGAVVQGNTPVLALGRNSDEHVAHTQRGRICAKQVLIATNGYTPFYLSNLKRRIIPVPSFLVVTEALSSSRVRELLPTKRAVSESRERKCYFRPSEDGCRIIFGGRAAMFNVPDAFAQSQIRALLTQIFPDLKGVTFSHSWRGRTGFTFDYLPHVGQLDDIWHAIGYSGSGNAMAPYLGHKAALQMLGDSEGETAFSKTAFPTRWWYRGRPWFLPFADITFRGRDLLNNFARK